MQRWLRHLLDPQDARVKVRNRGIKVACMWTLAEGSVQDLLGEEMLLKNDSPSMNESFGKRE